MIRIFNLELYALERSFKSFNFEKNASMAIEFQGPHQPPIVQLRQELHRVAEEYWKNR